VNVLSVTRNDKPENFWTQNNDEYVEIFTGSVDNVVDNYLDKGKHTFVIHWQSQNHIRSFENYDELYINAIGHNWRLPIEKSQVTLHLPISVEAIQSAAYFGAQGKTDQAKVTQKSPQDIQFNAPETLGNGKGFTVATGFTKGIIPSILPNLWDVWIDHFYGKLPTYIQPFNISLFMIIFVLIGYYLWMRMKHNRLAPKSKRVFTVRFSPPDLPLSQVFALLKPSNDETNQGILAILLNMHVKKIIQINQNEQQIILGENAQNDVVDPIEQIVISELQKKDEALSFESMNKQWAKMISKMSKELYQMNGKSYSIALLFHWLAIFPIIVILITLSIFVLFVPFLLYFALIFSVVAVVGMWIPSIKRIICSLQGKADESVKTALIQSIPFLLMGAIFSAGPLIIILFDTVQSLSIVDALIIYVLVIVAILIGRKLLLSMYALIHALDHQYVDQHQEVLEFKHFLQYTKEAEYQLITPELFEQYLPYSILFGVEKQWIKRYEHFYPQEFMNSKIIVLMNHADHSIGQSVNSASTTSSSTRSSSYGGSGFGSGGSGSSGGGSSGRGSSGGGGGGR